LTSTLLSLITNYSAGRLLLGRQTFNRLPLFAGRGVALTWPYLDRCCRLLHCVNRTSGRLTLMLLLICIIVLLTLYWIAVCPLCGLFVDLGRLIRGLTLTVD
jgi:hypothetical protein